MIINVKYKAQLPNVTGNQNDSVFCIENGIYYRISSITKRPILNEKVSVTTSIQPSQPLVTEFAEIGSIRVDSTSNKIYVCANNSDTENIIWKDITSEVTHANITLKDSGTYSDGGHTNLIPRVVSTSNPNITDSSYKIGTIWINTSSDTVFIITDNTENNAVWNEYAKRQIISDSIDMFGYVRYNYGDIVTYNNKTYFCIAEYVTSNVTPLVDTLKWKDVSTGFSTWSVSSNYVLHDIVKHNNEKYICIENRTAISNTPSPHDDTTHWLKMNYETEWIQRLSTCCVKKTILLSNVNSNNIFTFQFTGKIQEYSLGNITLSVIDVVENTSVTVMCSTPYRYNGEVTFKMIIN